MAATRSGTGSRAVARRRRRPPPGQPRLRWPAGSGRTRLPGCSIHRPAHRARPGGQQRVTGPRSSAPRWPQRPCWPGWSPRGPRSAVTGAPGQGPGWPAARPRPRARPVPQVGSAAQPAAPSPSSTAAPSPSVPAPGGAPAVVTMAPGLSQAPDAAQVDGFLASYFTAINTRDYQQYERLLVPARRAQLSAAAFARGYGTTTDTGASLVGISPTAGGVAATVTFTSEQRAAPGADVTGCTYWDITLYLRRQGGALLIGNPRRATTPTTAPAPDPPAHPRRGGGPPGGERRSGGGDTGGGAVQDQFDGDLHLLLGIEAVVAGERLPEPRVLAALQDGAEEGADGGSDLLIGHPEP